MVPCDPRAVLARYVARLRCGRGAAHIEETMPERRSCALILLVLGCCARVYADGFNDDHGNGSDSRSSQLASQPEAGAAL